jgi:hypothetical protein
LGDLRFFRFPDSIPIEEAKTLKAAENPPEKRNNFVPHVWRTSGLTELLAVPPSERATGMASRQLHENT